RAQALASALERPGRGIVLGALTSAAAFLAIWVIPYPAMRQVAWLTAFGLLAILVCSFTVLPLLLSISAPAQRSQSAWSRWGALFERALRLRPLVGLAPWVVLVAACVVVLPSLRFEPHPWRLAVRGNPESARLDHLSREMGSAFTPLLIVSRGRTDREALERDREAVQRLQPVALRAGVATIQSLARWLPSASDQRANIEFVAANRELFSPDRFRRDFEAAVNRMEDPPPSPYLMDEYLPLVTRGLNPDLGEVTLDELRRLGVDADVDRHLVQYASEYFAVSYVFLRQFPWAEGAVSGFLEVAREAGVDDAAGVTLAGDALRSATHTRVIRRAVFIATLIAVVLVGGLLWLRFRRVALVALCLAPLACGLSAALLVMWLLGLELNLLTITIAPVLVGIGVDDGIHMVERLRAGQGLGTVLRETGSSMTMTTLTTVGALACLALATFAGIRELGLVGAVGLLTCLLASLHLIPLGWQLVGPVERRPSETFNS
ncbi:MAG: MMPL family transporter, partial [Gemmatimonadales bacterium]|nr:MMPL family transporter [Gemmatimonadales bacterium]